MDAGPASYCGNRRKFKSYQDAECWQRISFALHVLPGDCLRKLQTADRPANTEQRTCRSMMPPTGDWNSTQRMMLDDVMQSPEKRWPTRSRLLSQKRSPPQDDDGETSVAE